MNLINIAWKFSPVSHQYVKLYSQMDALGSRIVSIFFILLLKTLTRASQLQNMNHHCLMAPEGDNL